MSRVERLSRYYFFYFRRQFLWILRNATVFKIIVQFQKYDLNLHKPLAEFSASSVTSYVAPNGIACCVLNVQLEIKFTTMN